VTGYILFRNPRLLILLVGLIVVTGLASFTALPRMEDPILTQRFGIIRTIFPGADADRIESQVTKPIEESIATLKGIKEIRSESIAGVSTISVELKEEITDVDLIWSRVRDEIGEVALTLPDDCFEPDFRQPELKAFAAIIGLKWTAEGDPNFAILQRLADDLKTVIRSIRGTESVSLFGEPGEEILVEISPDTLAATGLTVGDVAKQIEESEAKTPAGMVRSAANEMIIKLDEDFDSLARLGETPIRFGLRNITTLSEIATVTKSTKAPPLKLSLVDGKESIVVAAFVRDEYRIDRWSKDLEAELETFATLLPPGVEQELIFTQNTYVSERLTQLTSNLLLGTAAVVVVVFFLMGWRSMIVVGVALPLSAAIVITGIRFLGIPMQQMSVTGLIIALGLLIDNAIVMVDEVRDGIRRGETIRESITRIIGHLALPLFGSTLTTTLAFAPIAMLPGASGEFVGSIAISVILAINASFLLAMTVVPALTGLLSGKESDKDRVRKVRIRLSGPATPPGWQFWRDGFSNRALGRWYRWVLVHLFRFPVVGLCLGVALPMLGFYQARTLPEQFFPPADRNQFQVELELAASRSLSETRTLAEAIRESALELEEVERFHWFLGESAPTFFYNVLPRRMNAAYYGQAFVEIEKGLSPGETIRKLQDRIDEKFPTCRVLVRQLEQGPPFDAPVEVRIFGPDLAVLQRLGNEIRLLMTQTAEVVHTRCDLTEAVPNLALSVNEFEARMTGLSHGEIARQFYSSLEGMEAATLMEGTEEIPILVRVAGDTREDTGKIESFELRALTPRGRAEKATPFSSIGSVTLGSDVATIPHIDGKRVNEVKAYITAGTLPDLVMTDFRERLDASGFTLPPGYRLEFAGEAAERDEAVGNLMADVPILVVLMIGVLVSAFRSFRSAFIIAVVGGLSIGLGIGSLWAFGFPFGFMGVVGTMGLVGVAVNDAIVVMAGIREDPRARVGNPDALAEIVVRRTRHITATTVTTIVGFTPLILGGGGFWPPVAITIAGGVAGATTLALFFVPSLYRILIGLPELKEEDLPEQDPFRRLGGRRQSISSISNLGLFQTDVIPPSPAEQDSADPDFDEASSPQSGDTDR